MKKILLLLLSISINSIYAQVQFKSLEFEIGIRKHLNLTETEIIYLNSLDTIKKIDLSGLNIKDVNDVTFLKKIKVLNLSNNQIRDISPLLYLPRLKVLNIAGNNIENISTFTFSDKRSFKLIVSDNQISDFQNLQTATFSNVEIIGSDRQQFVQPTFLINNLYTLTQANGQAIIKYNVWDRLNICNPFSITYGDGITSNNLQCDSYTNNQNYSYSTEGFKTITITRDSKTLTTHFVAPYILTFDMGQSYPLNLSLPTEINLISLENVTTYGTATVISNQINYQPLVVGNDIIKVKYKYGTSNRTEVFYIFISNTNILSTNELLLLKNIKVYPNPTNNIINISSQNLTINQIAIYDLLGRLLEVKKTNETLTTINIQDLPNSIYFLEVKTAQGIKTEKIIKQ